MGRKSNSQRRRQVFLRLNSSKEFHKSGSISEKHLTCSTTNGRRQPVIATKESFKEFCSAYSKKVKSIRINKPGITRFAKNNFLLTKNVVPTANSVRSGARLNSAKRKIITLSLANTRIGCFVISTIEQTQSFPIFVKRNCATPLRESAAISASHVPNHGSTRVSNYRSTKIFFPTVCLTASRST